MVRRLVVMLLTPVMVIAGCSGGADDVASSTTFAPPLTNPPLPTSQPSSAPTSTEPMTTAASTTDPATTSTTTPESSTTAPDNTTATTDPDEYDWLAIVQGLSDVLVDLQGDPDPERITEFCFDSENDCQNIQGEAIRQFAGEGWKTLGFPRSVILSAELSATADGLPAGEAPFVVVLVDKGPADFSDARVVDLGGEVVFKITSEGEGGRSNWVLAQNSVGSWRVLGIQSLGEQ